MFSMNRQMVSLLDTLNGFLMGSEARLWFWALGQLLIGRLKILDDRGATKAWPVLLTKAACGEGKQVSQRFGQLYRCLLDQSLGQESLFLFSFFLEKKWVLDLPRLSIFSLVSPHDLDFFGGVEVSELLAFLDKIGFRSLVTDETKTEILESINLKRGGSHMFLLDGELVVLEVDYHGNYSWCFGNQKIREMYGDDPIIVIAK